MPTLFVTRRRVSPPAPFVGHVVEVLEPPTVERCAQLGVAIDDLVALWTGDRAAFWTAVGIDTALLGVGRPRRLEAVGLHNATPWERALVDHLATRFGLPAPDLDHEPTGRLASLAQCLTDPLAEWPETPPSGLATVEGDDPGLEAVGVATALRAELLSQPPQAWPAWIDDTLVLVPDSPSRLSTWRRVLEARGLPVQVEQTVRLLDTSFGRWLVAVAQLADWTEGPLDREVLRRVLLSPWCRLQRASRGELRKLLRALRRPQVTRSTWDAHVQGYYQRRRGQLEGSVELDADERAERVAGATEQEQAVLALTKRLADLWTGGDAWLRLRRLVGARGDGAMQAQRRAAAAGETHIREVGACIRTLDALVGQPTTNSPASTLQERLAAKGVRAGALSDHGLRLQSWSTWDGRGAARVVLAGLEDGGWPRSPRPLAPADRELYTALGGLDASEELSRQAQVAARALASASDHAWLSWSRTDEQRSQTFPGALIAGLPPASEEPSGGAPGREAWLAWRPVASRATAAAVLPDARQPPVDPVAVHTLAPAGVDTTGDARNTLARNRDAVTADERVQDGRTASTPTPWSGLLAEPLLSSDDRVSPTALEVLGACPTRYLFSKELRVEEQDDAGALLDPLEAGSMVHEALAKVAQQAGTWRPGDAGSSAELTAALTDCLHAQRQTAPSMSTGLLAATGLRWTRTLTLLLDLESKQGEGGLTASPDAADPDSVTDATLEGLAAAVGANNSTAARDLRDWIDAREELRVAMEFLDETDFTSFSSMAKLKEAWAAKRGAVKSRLPERLLKQLRSQGGAAEDLDQARSEVREKTDGKRSKAARRLQQVVAADRMAVPRRVVGAEWSFGTVDRGGADPSSVDAPLIVPLPEGRSLALKGQVDRIDAADDRGDLAVVDYKSGKDKTQGKLAAGFARGTDLQLAVYASAVDTLHPAAADGTVVAGRLCFVRTRKEAGLWLEPGGSAWSPESGAGEGDEEAAPANSHDVLLAHLDHAERRLSSGILPLKPRHCPLNGDADARCSYQRICGVDTDAAERMEDPHPQPRFEQVLKKAPSRSKTSSKPRLHEAGWHALAQSSAPPRAETAEPAHQAAVQAARDVTRDVSMSAGAGSGKTRALVGRYVAALEAGAQPSEVLAITFTRKATAEMRSRVRQALRTRSARASTTRKALREWTQALGAAPIWTLDSLAAALVRELGSDDGAAVATDAKRWSRRWLEGRLLDAADATPTDPDLQTLFDALPVAKVLDVVQSAVMTHAADRALPVLAELQPAQLIARWVAGVAAAAPALEELPSSFERLLVEVEAALAAETSGPDLEILTSLRAALRTTLEGGRQAGVIGLLWGLRRHDQIRSKKDASNDVNSLRERWNRPKARWMQSGAGPLAALYKELGSIGELDELHSRLETEATVTLAAMRLSHRWSRELLEARSEAGVLDYGDVLTQAIALLEDQDLDLEQLRTHFPFRHLLIDELQDTNAEQVHLVSTLRRRLQDAGLRPTLFGVGDPKQSIYRFRGAEVEVFEAQLEDHHKQLTMCWRSIPALTRSLGRLFEGLLATRDANGAATDPQAAVPWEPLAPKTDHEGSAAIDLLCHLPDPAAPAAEPRDDTGDREEDESLSAASTLSQYDREVASHIAGLLADHPDWTAAILCHSWNRAKHWGDALARCGVPAFVQGGRGLLETAEVRSILHLLDALESQDDDLSWLGLLRGPLCGLSDAGLVCLRRGRGLSFPSFYQATELEPAGPRNRLSRLRHGFRFSAEEAVEAIEQETGEAVQPDVAAALLADESRLTAFAGLWDAVDRDWGIAPLSDTVSRALHLSGLRAVLHHRGARGGPIETQAARRALVNLRTFVDLVDTVSAEGNLLPGDAVRRLRSMSKDGDDPADGGVHLSDGRSVAITTVHQAKGLEWDLVVLPDLERVGVKSRGADLVPVRLPGRTEAWTVGSMVERDDDLFRTTKGLGGRLAEVATLAAERAENRRLFYVAATRARERLVLGAPWPTGPKETISHELAKLRTKRASTAPMGLSHARSWFEDLVVALGLEAPTDDEATTPVFTRAWELGRDVRWVEPSGDIPGLSAAQSTTAVDPSALARAILPVAHTPWSRLNPSSARSGAPQRDPTRAKSAVPPLTQPAPVSDPRTAGTVTHRALERWGFRGAPTQALSKAALSDVLGDLDAPDAAENWLTDLLFHMERSQPGLVGRLRTAAAEGRLFHEVSVQVPDSAQQGRWEGLIDLLWQDKDGTWHLLDYKVTDVDAASADEHPPEPLDLDSRIEKYAPQVATYARLLQGHLPDGASVASFGLWFVRDGVVVTWTEA